MHPRSPVHPPNAHPLPMHPPSPVHPPTAQRLPQIDLPLLISPEQSSLNLPGRADWISRTEELQSAYLRLSAASARRDKTLSGPGNRYICPNKGSLSFCVSVLCSSPRLASPSRSELNMFIAAVIKRSPRERFVPLDLASIRNGRETRLERSTAYRGGSFLQGGTTELTASVSLPS